MIVCSSLSSLSSSIQGDVGNACTSVVTEYRQKQPCHTEPFSIEVDYHSNEDIQESVRELVWSYQKFHMIDNSMDQVTEEELRRCQNESKIAWWSLQAAFGHHKELEQVLDVSSGCAYDTIVSQIFDWVEELE